MADEGVPQRGGWWGAAPGSGAGADLRCTCKGKLSYTRKRPFRAQAQVRLQRNATRRR